MPKGNPKWMQGLNKRERDHIRQDANCRSRKAFRETVEWQEARRRENPEPMNEPCWECKNIARKLGWIN